MSVELTYFAFVAGEISPTLFGRTDLEKYDLGLALCRNFYVDYRGGISTRPGTEFVDYVMHDDKAVKLFKFQFAPNLANTYEILFGDLYIRFLQDGAYVLENDVTVTGITQASPGVVTATGHGFATGDWVKLHDVVGMTEVNGRTFEVNVLDVNTFELLDPFGADFDTSGLTAYVSGGVANRIYTLVSPYAAADLKDLRSHQIRDTLRLTRKGYRVRNLTRNDVLDWTLTEEDFGSDKAAPTGLIATANLAGDAGTVFTVTSVSKEGEESLPSTVFILTGIVDYSTTAGVVTVSWNIDAEISHYNVYRGIIVSLDDEVTRAMDLGFVGRSFGPRFVDNNIIPDFTKTPPRHFNPFANSTITHIEVTSAGTGYDRNDTVSVVDPDGVGFKGFPIINFAGAVIGVVVEDGGEGYTNPTVVFNTSTGSGAAATANVGPASGNDPAVSTVFQQRQIYAASENKPLTVWGGRPGRFSNFDFSDIVLADDSFEFEIDSDVVSSILHLVPLRGGLLILAKGGVWLLSGSESSRVVTPTNALADPQSYTGCAPLEPIPTDVDLLYLEGKGRVVRLLEFSDIARGYNSRDVTILSNHLLSVDNTLKRWAFAQSPHNLVWAVREDGRFLTFTFVKEQQVFAWAQHSTKGLVEDVLAIEEGNEDRVYLVVKRLVNGRWTKFIERMASRKFSHVEDAWCVDCGLSTAQVRPAATLTPAAASGNDVAFVASAAVFSAGDVGKVLRVGGGKATVTAFDSTTQVRANIIRAISKVLPETSGVPLPAEEGEWSLDSSISSVSGLHHLEGQEVQILLDGNVMPVQTVTNGAVGFDGAEGTKAIVGLGFRAIAQTLPPTDPNVSIESRRKNIIGSAVRVHDTRGLKVGSDVDHLYEMKERRLEPYGEPIELQEGFKYILVDSPWDEAGQTVYVQDHPLPATVLGLVVDMEIGDDTR